MLKKIGFNTVTLFTILFFLSLIFSSNKINAAVISPDKYYIEIQEVSQNLQKLVIYSIPNQERSIIYRIRPIGIIKTGQNNERTFFEPDGVDTQDASNWLEVLDKEVTVEPGTTTEVSWRLNIPSNFSCETKIAGIAISEVSSTNTLEQGAQVSIGNEVISQVHINTERSGDSNCEYYENLILQEFTTTQQIRLYNYDNIEFKTTIENRSDYLSKNIKGFIEIFGFGEKEIIEFNDSNLDVYPKSFRNFTSIWQDPEYPKGNFINETLYELSHFKFGVYTVRLGITKNLETPIISTINIFILPLRVILLITVILSLIIIFIRNNYKTRKELKALKDDGFRVRNKNYIKGVKNK